MRLTRCVVLGWLTVQAACAPAQGASLQPIAGPAPAGAKRVVLCADTVGHGGVVACVHELSVEQASHRELSYALTLQNGVVMRMERRNGNGAPVEASTGITSLDYRYEGGRVERTGRRADGRVVMRTAITDGGARRVWTDEWDRPWLHGDEEGNVASYDLDPLGRDVVERMLTQEGAPRRDSQGVYVWHYKYDERGLLLEQAAFDAAGQPMLAAGGWHAQRREYEQHGCLLSTTYLGLDGRPVVATRGVSSYRYTCDPWGNLASIRDLDAQGQPAQRSTGEWGARWTRDEHGNVIAHVLLDPKGAPSANARGVAELRYRYDDQGRRSVVTQYALDGSLIANPSGCARTTFTRDAAGRVIEQRCYDAQLQPHEGNEGAAVRTTYDARGRMVRQEHLGVTDAPSLGGRRYAVVAFAYDEHDDPTEVRYLGPDEQPVTTERGYSFERRHCGPDGKVSGREFYDASASRVELIGGKQMVVNFASAGRYAAARSLEEARARARKATAALRAGQPWFYVRDTFSDESTDDLGHFGAKHLIPPVQQAIAALAVGAISEPIETDRGIFILQRTP